MKKIVLIFFVFLLCACSDDPYELSQEEFKEIFNNIGSKQHRSVYFNQGNTIAFTCDEDKVEIKANGITTCIGKRRYIRVSKLTGEFKDKVYKKINNKLLHSREKMDILLLIKKVAKITKKSIVVHPKVHGKVASIKSTNPNEVFHEFSSILKAYNYILIDKKGILVIEPKYK